MSQVRRRLLITAAALLLAPVGSHGQRSAKVRRIGMLIPVSAADAAANLEAFRQGLRQLGYLEGHNIAIDPRYSDGHDKRFDDLAAEFARLKFDVIVTWGTPAARAAKRATRTIPIVSAAVVDPVGTGLIASLAQPGGNYTGVTSGGAELSRKSLELVKEMVPGASRIGVLWNPSNPVQPVMFRETQIAAGILKIRLQSFGTSDANELDSVLVAIRQERPDALIVLQDPMLQTQRSRILDFVSKMRLPAVYERKAWVDAGGLMSYGVSFTDNFRRAAAFVDKIFKGANPADLPVEDPTKFHLIVNLRTAKALGITIPQSLLIRADQVIQ